MSKKFRDILGYTCNNAEDLYLGVFLEKVGKTGFFRAKFFLRGTLFLMLGIFMQKNRIEK